MRTHVSDVLTPVDTVRQSSWMPKAPTSAGRVSGASRGLTVASQKPDKLSLMLPQQPPRSMIRSPKVHSRAVLSDTVPVCPIGRLSEAWLHGEPSEGSLSSGWAVGGRQCPLPGRAPSSLGGIGHVAPQVSKRDRTVPRSGSPDPEERLAIGMIQEVAGVCGSSKEPVKSIDEARGRVRQSYAFSPELLHQPRHCATRTILLPHPRAGGLSCIPHMSMHITLLPGAAFALVM